MAAHLQSQIGLLQNEMKGLVKRVEMLELEKYHDRKPHRPVLREDFLSRDAGVIPEGLALQTPAPQPSEADIITYHEWCPDDKQIKVECSPSAAAAGA